MPKRCPICNRSSAEIAFCGEFCRSCTEEKLLKKLPGEVEITVCKRCERVRCKGHFVDPSIENIQAAVEQQFKGYKIKFRIADETTAKIDVTEYKPDYSITVTKQIPVITKYAMCDSCNKRAGSYYEAVFQLRGPDLERMERFIERLTRYFEVRNEFIAHVKEADNGLDVYVSNKKLAAEYIRSHKLVAVTSYTLYGLKNGKKVYRHTYAIRL